MNKYTVRLYKPYYSISKEFKCSRVFAKNEIEAIKVALKGRTIKAITQYPSGSYGVSMARVEYSATVQMTMCNVKLP